MHNIIGPPVTGEDFFGREKEIQYAWKSIKSGNNLLLPSPRRVGKTSFALKLLEMAKDEGWNTVSINLEKISTEQEFIETFVDELKSLSWWQEAKDKGNTFLNFLRQFKPSISHGDMKVEVEWHSNKENIYKQLAELLDHSERTLIFFDELTILLTSIINNGPDGKKNVTEFLHWLRNIRIVKGSKIRWIVCSSVGIENFTHRYGISDTINDVPDYKLQSYTREVSIKMLRALSDSNSLVLGDKIPVAIVDKLEYCLPFFLQIMFEKIHYLADIEGMPVNEDIVESAYNALIEEKHFNTWIERINGQYGVDARYAFMVLKHICQVNQGVSRGNLVNSLVASGINSDNADEIVSRLLYMLKNDGYLMEEKELYYFRSPLLRDFWFNRFVK
jgi:AAA+ ATPase superfamily predicted ATPase